MIDDLKRSLMTPKDSTKMTDDSFACALVLSFIGYVARPSGIDKDLLEKCVKAFNENRGKVESEALAVEKVITAWRKEHASSQNSV